MLSSTIISGLLLGLYQIHSGVAQPVEANSFIVSHAASDHFPNAKGDMSPFDVDVRYTGYSAATQSWLTSLDPATGTNDEEKAKMITAAAYAKPFDANDPDMAADLNAMMATIAGNATTTGLHKRDGPSYDVSTAHAIKWGACAAFFGCISGTYCTFSIDVGQAPRSDCQEQGGSNCCISWSNYNVRAGFFSATWTNCNNEVTLQQRDTASCEGYGGSAANGGDVCLSNRANGCT